MAKIIILRVEGLSTNNNKSGDMSRDVKDLNILNRNDIQSDINPLFNNYNSALMDSDALERIEAYQNNEASMVGKISANWKNDSAIKSIADRSKSKIKGKTFISSEKIKKASGAIKNSNTMRYKVLANKNTIEESMVKASTDMNKYIDNVNSEYTTTALKDSMKAFNKSLAVGMIGVSYANQVYSLVRTHQNNTYQMSGMTTAAMKQRYQDNIINLSNKGLSVGVGFMINPILGATQLAMEAIKMTADYYENMRKYSYEQDKVRTSSNYYRRRLASKTISIL